MTEPISHGFSSDKLARVESDAPPNPIGNNAVAISLGSASIIAAPVWRSTKNDPPKDGGRIFVRHWTNGRWDTTLISPYHARKFSEKYVTWASAPNPNDGTAPKDWL